MKILNNLNTSSIIRRIIYPFIKIASLFQRVTVANRIKIMENTKYLSTTAIQKSSKSPILRKAESFISNISIDEDINEYQDQHLFIEKTAKKSTDSEELKALDTFKRKQSSKADPTHLYTRINKTTNGEIQRYLASDESKSQEDSEIVEQKRGQVHPFLIQTNERETDSPFVTPKNRVLLQKILQRDVLRFPRAAQEMRLSILKGSELFI